MEFPPDSRDTGKLWTWNAGVSGLSVEYVSLDFHMTSIMDPSRFGLAQLRALFSCCPWPRDQLYRPTTHGRTASLLPVLWEEGHLNLTQKYDIIRGFRRVTGSPRPGCERVVTSSTRLGFPHFLGFFQRLRRFTQ
ncbi:hypothetical protein AFLA_000607 [Aspergillus flavus NRRL3357]|nr:hypothetical protein AFLA_000607 [Aspergillus flavus NRRL3357]